MSEGELTRRVAVAALGIPVALLLVYLGGWALAMFLAFAAGVAGWEFYRLSRAQGIRPFTTLGVGGAVALVLSAGAFRSYAQGAPWAMGVLLFVFLLSGVLAVRTRWPDGRPLSDIGVTVGGAVYTGGCFSFGVYLRHLPETMEGFQGGLPLQGMFLLAFPLAVTWIGDSAAFFGGHRFGKRKLLPAVSPAKTIAGSVASLLASALVGGAMGGWLLVLHPVTWLSTLLGAALGVILGVGAQVGDLLESVLKREAGVKDSGTLLPGHGGLLDRFDALLFNLPLTYAMVRLTGLLP